MKQSRRSGAAETPDPIERYGFLAFKLAVYGWLSFFFYEAITTFDEYVPGQGWPFMLNTFRMFTFLPIHEAGHFLFVFFGRTLNILGGSFWQIMFPLLWFIIAARQRSHVAPFALFWVGENCMDVSLYMRDAPLRQLPLLGGHASRHDWYNLFSDWNLLGSAELIADVMFFLGIIVCVVAIGSGVGLAIHSFLTPKPSMPFTAAAQTAETAIEDSLDEYIERRESRATRLD